MAEVRRPNIRIPQNLVGTELGDWLRQLAFSVNDIRNRTGGDDDTIDRIETETLFDTGIKNAEIAEMQKSIEAANALLIGAEMMLSEVRQVHQALLDQIIVDDTPLIMSELTALQKRVEALENEYNT